MALPELTVPAGLPPFLAATHAIELVPVFAHVPVAAGHGRTRRLFTAAPRIVSVTWDLTQAQMTSVDAWYEDILQAGKRQFAAQVANQGAGLLWWTAEWEEPYQAEPSQIADWLVTGRLRLTGTGAATGPAPSTLRLSVAVAVLGSATPTVLKKLVVSINAPLMPPAAVSSAGVGLAVGRATVLGASPTQVPRSGAAAGVATVLGVSIIPAAGAAQGTSTVFARSDTVGISKGAATAAASSLYANRGNAAGAATATAAGRSASRGSAAGLATVTGVKL